MRSKIVSPVLLKFRLVEVDEDYDTKRDDDDILTTFSTFFLEIISEQNNHINDLHCL